MNDVIIEFGSNINPNFNILQAKKEINSIYEITKESKFIKTKPIGDLNQPDYINGAVRLLTPLSLKEFDAFLKKIEVKLGRIKSAGKHAARIIDLDIIIWNKKVIHNDFYERDFVKQNIFEITTNIIY